MSRFASSILIYELFFEFTKPESSDFFFCQNLREVNCQKYGRFSLIQVSIWKKKYQNAPVLEFEDEHIGEKDNVDMSSYFQERKLNKLFVC